MGEELDANGVNQYGVAMCECGNKRVHAYEPGEWCGDRMLPKPSEGRPPMPTEPSRQELEKKLDEAYEAWKALPFSASIAREVDDLKKRLEKLRTQDD